MFQTETLQLQNMFKIDVEISVQAKWLWPARWMVRSGKRLFLLARNSGRQQSSDKQFQAIETGRRKFQLPMEPLLLLSGRLPISAHCISAYPLAGGKLVANC